MRRLPLTLVTALALAALAALAAPATLAAGRLGEPLPEVTVHLYDGYVEGAYWENAVDLTATLRDRDGVLKASCTVQPRDTWISPTTIAPGTWDCSWSLNQIRLPGEVVPLPTIVPGDTVEVTQSGVPVSSGPLSAVRLRQASPARDTVSGIVWPRRRASYAKVYPAGADFGAVSAEPFEAFGTVRRDGTFTLPLAAGGGIDRRDTVRAGYAAGPFRVVRTTQVPGLYVEKDTNRLALAGLPFSLYRVVVLRANGTVKARARVLLGGSWPLLSTVALANGAGRAIFPGNTVSFTGRSGRPVRIRSGDRIRVIGWSGFSYRVPRLELALAGRDLAVATLPNRDVWLSELMRFPGGFGAGASTVVTSDAAGLATWTLPPIPVPAGDESVSAAIYDRGNYVSTTRLVLP